MRPSPLLPRRAAAQTDANLSAHLHRLPTPPPYLRQMRLLHGRVRRYWVLGDAVARPGRRCWVANDAAGCPWQSSCKSPRTLQKCKLLITKQLTFGAVLGEHKLSSPSTRLKVNHLCIRYLCIKSARGDFLEGHSYASHATYPSSRVQKCHFCARGGGFWSSERKFWYAECYVKLTIRVRGARLVVK